MEDGALIPDLVLPAPARRRIDIGGGGRATRAALPTLAEIQRGRPGTDLVVFEPRATKGTALALDARRADVVLTPRTMKLEVGAAAEPSRGLLVVLTDDPRTLATVLRAPWAAERPIFGSCVIALAGRVAGLRVTAAPGDERARREGALLFDRVSELWDRQGSSAITSRPAWAAAEEGIRRWQSAALAANAERLDADLAAEGDAIELTYDGRETLPLLVVGTSAVEEPRALAERVLADELRHRVLARGKRFVVAEVPESERVLRLHEAQIRLTDGKLALAGTQRIAVDAPAPSAAPPEIDGLAAIVALAAVLALAGGRAVASPTSPITVTD